MASQALTGDDAIDQITDGSEVNEDTRSGPLTAEELRRAASITNSSRPGNLPAPVNLGTARPNIPFGTPLAVGGYVKKENLPFRPSPSLDPRHIEGIEDYTEFAGYLAPALNCLSSAVEGLKQIDDAWEALRKDQSKTEAQKSLAIEPAASKKLDQMNRTFVKAQEDLAKAVAMIEQELTKPIVTAATASAANAELRTVIRGMKLEDRNALIDKAVRDEDETVVNAVLGVHHLITGIDPKRQQLWTRQVHEQCNPALVRRLNATRKAIAVLAHAAPIALGQVEQAMRMTFKDSAKLKGLSDASSAALAKLTGATP